MNKKHKVRAVLVSLILLFIIPMLLARFFYQHPQFLPKHTTNRGQLLSPVMTLAQLGLPAKELQDQWGLLLVQKESCDVICHQQLNTMQQIQRALGKNMNHLQKILLTGPQSVIDTQLAGQLSKNTVLHWQGSQEIINRLSSQRWYVIDPSGNIILSYAADQQPENILDDLGHLMIVNKSPLPLWERSPQSGG